MHELCIDALGYAWLWCCPFHVQGICFACSGVFSEAAAAADPQPCSVQEFPSAAACLISHPEPHFILFTADPDPDTGPLHLCSQYRVHVLLCMVRSLALASELSSSSSALWSMTRTPCCAGEPWCPDCARGLEPARARAAEAGGTLLEIQARLSDQSAPLGNMPCMHYECSIHVNL